MDKLSTQTSIQAIDVYKQALKNSNLDLSISRSGNVYIANAFDRTINSIRDYFQTSSIEQRREQAKLAIRQKFDVEMQILGTHFPTAQRKFMDSALNLMIDGERLEDVQKSGKTQPYISAFNLALQHIQSMSSGDSKESNRIAWQATQEFLVKGNRLPDTGFARKVSDLTERWKKELNLGDRAAYRLAFNAVSLHRRYGIDETLARGILQVSGKLHIHEGINKNDALHMAIDLHMPMKKLGIEIDMISRIKKTLLSKIPELKKTAPTTQISAAILYAQLKKTGHDDAKALLEILDRLKQIPVMQSIMPKGCVVNQIHQGSHVRGYVNVGESGLKKFAEKVNSLTEYPTFSQGEVKTKLPDEYRHFEQQFVKDFVRGFRYELRQQDLQDTEFLAIESKRRRDLSSPDPASKMSQDDFSTWAKYYQQHAGSVAASEASSRLQSQTIFGEVENITAHESSHVTGYLIKESASDGSSTETTFSSNRRIKNGEVMFDFKATRKVKAVILLADPIVSDASDIQPAPAQLHLLANDEWLPKMGHDNPTVIREYQLTIAAKTLDAGKTDCINPTISETWDLMPNWDDWMSRASPML